MILALYWIASLVVIYAIIKSRPKMGKGPADLVFDPTLAC